MTSGKTPKLLLVRWTDAQADLGWKEGREVKADKPGVLSVGWLMKLDKETIIIAGDIGNDAESNRRIEIPRGIVTEVVEVNLEETEMAKPKARKKPLKKKPVKRPKKKEVVK